MLPYARCCRDRVHRTTHAVTALDAHRVATPVVAPASTASALNASFMIAPLRARIITGADATCAFRRFRQRTMSKRNRDRAFTDGRRHALDVAPPNVADGEHTRTRGFEEVRRPREGPMRLHEVVSCQV